MASRYLYGDPNPVIAPVLTAQGIAQGDLVGLSSGNVVRASDTTWDTDLATTQAAFVLLFAGVAAQKKTAAVALVPGNSVEQVMRVDATGVYEFDCASASFAVGALVGPAKQSGDLLENQKVAAAGSESVAIGRVVEDTSSATKVKVRILPKLLPVARQS